MTVEVQINIDCADPDALRAFYCAALGYREHAQFEQYRSCLPAEGASGPKIVFQQVPEGKAAKNRVHLDFVVDDIEAEARRWVALGATRVSAEPIGDVGGAWIVMRDPEGNEFCLCDA